MDCSEIVKKKKSENWKFPTDLSWPGHQSLSPNWLASKMRRSDVGIQVISMPLRFVGRKNLAEIPRVVVKRCWVAPGQLQELLASLFSAFIYFMKFNSNSFFPSLLLYSLPSFSKYLLRSYSGTIVDTVGTAGNKMWNFMQVWGKIMSK